MAELIETITINAEVFNSFLELKAKMSILPQNPELGQEVEITASMLKTASAKQLRSLLYYGPQVFHKYKCIVTQADAPVREFPVKLPEGTKLKPGQKPEMQTFQNAVWAPVEGAGYFDVEGLTIEPNTDKDGN